jgi:hypothetical protein
LEVRISVAACTAARFSLDLSLDTAEPAVDKHSSVLHTANSCATYYKYFQHHS